jgi:phosphoribosylamine--glycine ligase
MTDLAQLLLGAADGVLDRMSLRWFPQHAVTVVLASRGYPGPYRKGTVIRGVEALAGQPDILLFHAGTRCDAEGRLLAEGGRVLDVTALGPTLAAARERAYAAVDRIDWADGYCRRDIAAHAGPR